MYILVQSLNVINSPLYNVHTLCTVSMHVLCIPSLPIRESFWCTSFGGPAGDSSCWGRPGWSLWDKTVGLGCIQRGCVWDCCLDLGCLRNSISHCIRRELVFWWLEGFDSWILRLVRETFSLPGFEEVPIPSVDCSIAGSD